MCCVFGLERYQAGHPIPNTLVSNDTNTNTNTGSGVICWTDSLQIITPISVVNAYQGSYTTPGCEIRHSDIRTSTASLRRHQSASVFKSHLDDGAWVVSCPEQPRVLAQFPDRTQPADFKEVCQCDDHICPARCTDLRAQLHSLDFTDTHRPA